MSQILHGDILFFIFYNAHHYSPFSKIMYFAPHSYHYLTAKKGGNYDSNTFPQQVINHVVNHVNYHRGEVTAMLHQLDYKRVPTDYAAYLYQLNK